MGEDFKRYIAVAMLHAMKASLATQTDFHSVKQYLSKPVRFIVFVVKAMSLITSPQADRAIC